MIQPMTAIARSFLFVPGHRPDRIGKAIRTGTHAVVLDLEDAVAPADKAAARASIVGLQGLGCAVFVRINGASTEWYRDDVAALRACAGVGVMLPKAERRTLEQTAEALPDRLLIALVETVRGYFDLRAMAESGGLQRFAFGSVDFALESGIEDEGEAMTAIRNQIVLESALAGLSAPIDGVSVNLSDTTQMGVDAARSRRLGFGGKLCIHPAQIDVVNAAFLPSADEVQWARRVIAAFAASRDAATAVDGKMIDKPVVDRARRILTESACPDIA